MIDVDGFKNGSFFLGGENQEPRSIFFRSFDFRF